MGNRPPKLTDSAASTRGSPTAARTGVRLLFRFQGAEALARISSGPRRLRLGVGALPAQGRYSSPEGGEKHYPRRSRASTFAGRNLGQVVRALALAQQQVAAVEQRDRVEALVSAEGDAVGPDRALLQ